MILPNKNILLPNSILGLGLIILKNLSVKETVSSLWQKAKGERINTFGKYILVLDFLYTLKLIDSKSGLIFKRND